MQDAFAVHHGLQCTHDLAHVVHGAWHGSWCLQRLLSELDGVDVRTVDLPTQAIPPDAQRLMAARTGGTVHELETSHLPLLPRLSSSWRACFA